MPYSDILHKPEQRITAIYLLVAALWILFSDSILHSLGIDESLIPSLSMLKGLAFVIVTSAILYMRLRFEFDQRSQLEAALREQMERVQASQATLAQSERRFRKAVEEAPLPILIFAEDGEILSVSQTWLEITGYTADQLTTLDSWLTLAYGERKEQIQPVVDRLFELDKRVDEGEFTVRCADETERIWTFSSTPLGQLRDNRRVVISMATDITERKHMENDLRKFADIFQYTQTGIVVGYPDTPNLELLNPAFAQMHGYTVEELTGEPISSVFTPDDRSKLAEAVHISQEQGYYIFEADHLHKNGSTFPTLISTTAVKNPSGQVKYRISTVQDITSLKQLQQELHEKNQFLQTLVQASPLGIIVFDPQGAIQIWNPALEAILGWSIDEVIGNPLPYVREQDQTEFANLRQRVAAGETFKGVAVQRQRKDGTTIDLSISAGPLYDLHGAFIGVVGIVEDISERKRMENDLRESELRFRQIAENIREVFYLNDAEKQKTLYISPAYETIWGRSCQSLYQNPRSFLTSIHPDDRQQVLKTFDLQRSGQQIEVTYRVVRPDQTIRWVRSRAFPMRDENGLRYRIAGIAEDITERIQYQNQLKRLSQRLVTMMDDERARIARELHDQVGQQLTGLSLNLAIVAQQYDLTMLDDATELISSIIERIRLIIADLRPLALDDMGLGAGLRWYCEKFTHRMGIPVSLSLPQNDLTFTPIIDNTFYQIAQEALTNIAKHAAATEAWVDIEIGEDQLMMSIKDNGNGFDAQTKLAHEKAGSWGLQIMQERVQALAGARLFIDSQPGQGTTVRVVVQL